MSLKIGIGRFIFMLALAACSSKQSVGSPPNTSNTSTGGSTNSTGPSGNSEFTPQQELAATNLLPAPTMQQKMKGQFVPEPRALQIQIDQVLRMNPQLNLSYQDTFVESMRFSDGTSADLEISRVVMSVSPLQSQIYKRTNFSLIEKGSRLRGSIDHVETCAVALQKINCRSAHGLHKTPNVADKYSVFGRTIRAEMCRVNTGQLASWLLSHPDACRTREIGHFVTPSGRTVGSAIHLSGVVSLTDVCGKNGSAAIDVVLSNQQPSLNGPTNQKFGVLSQNIQAEANGKLLFRTSGEVLR